jgi:hypothetical protein
MPYDKALAIIDPNKAETRKAILVGASGALLLT